MKKPSIETRARILSDLEAYRYGISPDEWWALYRESFSYRALLLNLAWCDLRDDVINAVPKGRIGRWLIERLGRGRGPTGAGSPVSPYYVDPLASLSGDEE